jgi:hypothetical protein
MIHSIAKDGRRRAVSLRELELVARNDDLFSVSKGVRVSLGISIEQGLADQSSAPSRYIAQQNQQLPVYASSALNFTGALMTQSKHTTNRTKAGPQPALPRTDTLRP